MENRTNKILEMVKPFVKRDPELTVEEIWEFVLKPREKAQALFSALIRHINAVEPKVERIGGEFIVVFDDEVTLLLAREIGKTVGFKVPLGIAKVALKPSYWYYGILFVYFLNKFNDGVTFYVEKTRKEIEVGKPFMTRKYPNVPETLHKEVTNEYLRLYGRIMRLMCGQKRMDSCAFIGLN